eukprot:TRINITY_DN1316_c0_g2_i2.p1 TRINITY_DN1316_c0_g2~~TRINITY_DN1316_c0_g2_i2.p1  ORF type:complete len:267 (+),score=27.47 TRINITY_DN1316_c0_g2_i2:201-1001(+)
MYENRGGYDSPKSMYSPIHADSPYRGKSKRPNRAIIPCTVYQILTAEQLNPSEDVLHFSSGITASQVCLIGQVTSQPSQATNLNYTLNDSTGAIDVHMYVNPSSDLGEHQVSGIYVRVLGHLRLFQQTRSVVASRLILIEDFNELVHHQLQIIELHLSVQATNTANNPSTANTTNDPPTSKYPAALASTSQYSFSSAVTTTTPALNKAAQAQQTKPRITVSNSTTNKQIKTENPYVQQKQVHSIDNGLNDNQNEVSHLSLFFSQFF